MNDVTLSCAKNTRGRKKGKFQNDCVDTQKESAQLNIGRAPITAEEKSIVFRGKMFLWQKKALNL